jgi:hypothetical protein
MGRGGALTVAPPPFKNEEDDKVEAAERKRYEDEIADLKRTNLEQLQEINSLRETTKQNMAALSTLADVRRSFAALVGAPASGGNGKAAAPVHFDTETIVTEVLRRMPRGAGATIVVQAPEALRKEFQQREVDRVLEYLRELDPRARDAVRLLEATDKWLSFSAISARLGISQGDGSMKLNKAIKEVAADGYLEIKERAGVHGTIRQKLADDLATYGASEEDVEQTYAACIAALAEAVAA